VYCPKCGQQADDSAHFCRACGSSLRDAVAQTAPGGAGLPTPQISEAGDSDRSNRRGLRIATLVISLVLTFLVGLQSCAVYGLSSVAGQQSAAGGGAVGVLVALLYLLGAAFVLGLPTVSTVCFALAGLFGIAVGMNSAFKDLPIWGAVGLILAGMSFFARGRKRRGQKSSPRTS
jgi:hypothetical protein